MQYAAGTETLPQLCDVQHTCPQVTFFWQPCRLDV